MAGLTPKFFIAAVLLFGALTMEAKNKWLYSETEHFRVLTNANPRDARLLVARLEQFRETVLAVLPGPPIREPRTTIVIFDSNKDFTPYKPLYQGKPQEQLAGVFAGRPDEVVIAMSTERELEQTIPVIYHEYLHLLMHARGFRLPPWLNEGFAGLFSTFETTDDEAIVGRSNPIHITLLSHSPFMPLAKLFAVAHGSPEYNEGTKRTLFYAQSWALIHYLQCGMVAKKDQAANSDQFLDMMQSGLPAETCTQKAFGKTLTELENDLQTYIRGGRYFLRHIKIAKVDYEERVKFRPATDEERDTELANLKWRLQRNGDAAYQFLQLAERYPNSPRPQELLAAESMNRQETSRAFDYWLEAIRLHSDNPYIYIAKAEDVLSKIARNVDLNYRLKPEQCDELRAMLDRACELDTNYAQAWEWLAITEALAPEVRQSTAKELVKRAEVLRRRPRAMMAIALIALRQKNLSLADQITHMLLADPTVTHMPQKTGGVKAPAISGIPTATGGNSWLTRRESYPDVLHLARLAQRQIQAQKKAAGDDATQPSLDIDIKDVP